MTRPAFDTEAIVGFDELHVGCWFVIAVPWASLTVAVTGAVSPINVSVSVVGSSETVAGTCSTVTGTLLDALPAVAVMVVEPLPAAVTRPEDETLAMEVLLLVHTSAIDTVPPLAFRAVAVIWADSPRDANDSEVTEKLMETGPCVEGSVGSPRPQESTNPRNRQDQQWRSQEPMGGQFVPGSERRLNMWSHQEGAARISRGIGNPMEWLTVAPLLLQFSAEQRVSGGSSGAKGVSVFGSR